MAAVAFLGVLSLSDLRITDDEPGAAARASLVAPNNLIRNASAEFSTGAWGKSRTATLATVESARLGVDGSHVFRLRRKTAGTSTVSAYAPAIKVDAGESINATASLVSIAAGRSAVVGIQWKAGDAGDGAYLGAAPNSKSANRSGSLVSTTATAPAEANSAIVVVSLIEAKQGDVLDFDAVVGQQAASPALQ
jgi:hypothetical protein